MYKILLPFLAVLGLAWAIDFFLIAPPAASGPWLWRSAALTLSGLWAIGLMSLIMLLATRPSWLETRLGGLDKVYRLHKWAGIVAILTGALHWLVKLSGGLIADWYGRAGKPARQAGNAVFEAMHGPSKELGEWAIYALLAMLVLTLWQRFPFRPWRVLHRLMPVLYLMLVVHAVFLAPPQWWGEPVGWLLAGLLVVGSTAAVQSLLGRIGARRKFAGTLLEIQQPAPDLTEIVCRLEDGWPGHRAGQFAFLTLHPGEGAHPFTIASADRGDRCLRFAIKALGDYTRGLAARLTPGQRLTVEGPYGCFDFRDAAPQQIWIAGGVGITPFLAGLDALAQAPATPVRLYYCTRDTAHDPFVARLREKAARLPGVELHVRDTGREGPLTVDVLAADTPDLARASLWFCGPEGFSRALRRELASRGLGHLPFHQEIFAFR